MEVLGFPVDAVDVDAALARVSEAHAAGSRLHVITLNAEMTMQGRSDPELAEILRRAGLVLPDGSGVVWAMRRRGRRVGKVPGVEFVEHLAAWCAREGRRMFFLGGAEGIAAQAAEVLVRRHPGLDVIGTRSGFFTPEEELELIAQLREFAPDVLLVALGVPRQEKWIARHQPELGVRVAMGVGGSFDVLAGKVRRAPWLYRACHLEWLFRLIQEPWRWRRMSATLPQFVWRVWQEE